MSSGVFVSAPGGVRVRQRTATRFEALKRDLFTSRLARCRGLAQVPHIAVDPDIILDLISPSLPDQSELKFVDVASDGERLVVVSRTTVLILAGKRVAPRGQGEPVTDGMVYSPSLTVPVGDVAGVYDSTLDETVVYMHTRVPARMSQRDREARLYVFASALLRDKFIAHLLQLLNPELVEAASEHRDVLPTGGVTLRSWDSALHNGDDIRKNLALDAKRLGSNNNADQGNNEYDPDVQTTLLETCEFDFFQVAASRDVFCAKLKAAGEARVLFSSETALKSNSHDVVVLCDRAVYFGKVRKEHKVRHRIPYEAIEGVVVDTTNPTVVVKLDFSQVSLRGDLSLRFSAVRQRDAFVSTISSAFEAQVIDRLPVAYEEDVFWSKRGLVESQLLRVVSAVKTNRFTRAIGALGGEEPPTDGITPELARALKALLYELRVDTLGFLNAASGAGIPDVERDFIARCLFAVFDNAGWLESLLRWSVQATLDRALYRNTIVTTRVTPVGGIDASAVPPPRGVASTRQDQQLLFDEEGSVAGAVVKHYTSQCGEQYMQVVFAQVIDRFVTDGTSFQPLTFAAAIEEWVGRFLRPVLQNTDGDLLADEVKIVMALLHERVTRSEHITAHAAASGSAATPTTATAAGSNNNGNAPTVDDITLIQLGRFFYAKLVHPSLTAPLQQGLVLVEPAPVQLDNLRRIAVVLRAVLSRDASLILAPNSPVADLSDLDKQELVKLAESHFAPAKDLLKGFVFSDMLQDENGDDELSRNAPAVTAVREFLGHPRDSAALRAHINDTVVLTPGHNPKLLSALFKALQPYAANLFSALGSSSAASADNGGSSGRRRSRAAVPLAGGGSAGKAGAGPAAGSSSAAASAPNDAAEADRREQARVEAAHANTIQQLTHEVLDLRQTLRDRDAECKRLRVLAARLQERLATAESPQAGGKKKKHRSVRFTGAGSDDSAATSSSSTSSDSSDSSDSDAGGGDVVSPSRNESSSSAWSPTKQRQGSDTTFSHQQQRSAKRTSNPLQPGSPLPTRVRAGLSPAAQEYRRALAGVNSETANPVPESCLVFGCPLDTYIIGRGRPDPMEDPDL